MHTKLLTIRVAPFALLCLPAVMKSNFSFRLPSQSFIEIGIRFCLKSPAVGSMNRHWPLAAFNETLVNDLVAVASN